MVAEAPVGSFGHLHFLESLDSTRMTWARLTQVGGDATDEWRAYEVNLLFEVLVSLAFGRTIAVPQPYAFDSLGFMRVASKVLRARNDVARREPVDRPFQLCLFGGTTFETMIRGMLGRIADAANPFRSSLFPELHDLAADELNELANDPDLIRTHVSEGGPGVEFDRFLALDLMRNEFRLTPSIKGKTNGNAPLNGMLTTFVNQEPGADQADDLALETRARLRSSIRAMLNRTPDLDVRTHFHTEYWPGRQRIRTEDVAGGATELKLAREFADTAYNCLLSRSAATPTGLFTTPGISDRVNRNVARLSIAQDLAIAEFSARFPDTLPPRRIGGTSGPIGGESGSVISIAEGMTKAKLASDLAEAASVLTNAIESVLARRADRESDFWQSVASLDSAVDRIDRTAPPNREPRGSREARRVFEAHVALIGDLFGRRLETTQSEEHDLIIGLVAGGVTTYFTGEAGASPLWSAIAGMIAGAVPYGYNKLSKGWQQHSTRKRWRKFLGTSIAFSERSE